MKTGLMDLIGSALFVMGFGFGILLMIIRLIAFAMGYAPAPLEFDLQVFMMISGIGLVYFSRSEASAIENSSKQNNTAMQSDTLS